jgi:hypothetical protein
MSQNLEDQFFGKVNKKSKKKDELLDNLYKTPKRDSAINTPHYQPVGPNVTHQADVLFLPEDNNFKYLLVVVDVRTRKVDAEPLKKKDNVTVLSAFKNIYARNILKLPKNMEIDPGAEFKGSVREWLDKNKVAVRVGKVGRHRQQAIVERMNQTIAKALFRRMAGQELLTGEVSREWVDDLPKLIEIINKRTKERKVLVLPDDPVCEGDACQLLAIGTNVRAIAEEPRDPVTGNKLHGKFRATDQRWNSATRVIKQILLKPGYPPLYLLDGNSGRLKVEPIAYTKGQLQVIPDNEKQPDKEFIRGKPNKWIIEKIIGKQKIKNKIYYKILWKGFSESEATLEPRTELMKDTPDIIREYEKNNK